MMRNRRHLVAAAAVVMVASAIAAPAVFAGDTGLKKGDSASAFDVMDITGPNKGKTLCYVWRYGNSPVLVVFARDVDDGLVGLIKRVDEIVASGKVKKFKAFVVALGNETAFAKKLTKVAQDNELSSVPLTVAKDGAKGPKSYKLDAETKTTILLYAKGKKIQEAWAVDSVGEAEVEAVVKAIESL